MSKFYLEVLGFQYPKDQLFQYQQHIKNWKPNVHYSSLGINTFSVKWFDHYPDINEPLIKEITSKINLNFESGCCKFVTLLEGGNLPFHIDPNRECVFMLPLTDDNSGIQWIDQDQNILCDHVYRGPTVINAKILHGVPSNTKTRSFLQVNLPCTWNDLISNKEHIFNNLTNW